VVVPGFPAPFIKFREDDANGFPLAGGKLWSYVAGTSTPIPTYSNQALTTPNTNPTILDASGRANIWVQDGVAYKFLLTDALGNQVWTQDNVQVPLQAAPPAAVVIPPGAICAFGGSTAPTGWLLCDGQAYLQSTYPDLYGAILLTYGAGGAGTFRVPDLRQRFPLGKSATGGTGNALGETGGLINHVHTGPSHTHTIDPHQHDMGAHQHGVTRAGWGSALTTPGTTGYIQTGNAAGAGGDASQYIATQDTVTSGSTPNVTSSVALTTKTDGTQNTGPANPPYLTLQFIIKT